VLLLLLPQMCSAEALLQALGLWGSALVAV
jgi:hypothetical protein